MQEVIVRTGLKSYPILFECGFENFIKYFEKYCETIKDLVIITDDNVNLLYGNILKSLLTKCDFNVEIISIKPGETSKDISIIQDIYKYLLNSGIRRDGCIIALGGGVVGDIAGFVASTYMRGIKYVQIPTTFLSQIDSSIGGKNGINFLGNKNIVGTFYHPEFVYINMETLATLPYREFISGFAEVLKYGIIFDKDFFEFLYTENSKILNLDKEYMKYIIKKCCEFKAKIVQEDEKDVKDIRAVLNFGHTLGHVLENLSDYCYKHGEAVTIGMVFESVLSNRCGFLKDDELNLIIKLLKLYGLPIKFKGIDIDLICEKLFYDKKVRKGRVRFILPLSIGNYIIYDNVNKNDIVGVLRLIKEE